MHELSFFRANLDSIAGRLMPRADSSWTLEGSAQLDHAPQGGRHRDRAAQGAAKLGERRDQQAAQARGRHHRAAAEGARNRRPDHGPRRAGEGARRAVPASCWRGSRTCRTSRFPRDRSEADNVEVRRWGQPRNSISSPRRIGTWARSSASWTSSGRRRSQARGSPCTGAWGRSWSGR